MPHVEGDAVRHRDRSGRPDPRHQAAADHRRRHHERLPDHQQPRHHLADPAERRSSRAARPTAGPWPTSRTSTWATRFGTVYDVSTIAILWFAGASAMAGLLNLVPRYLPRYGMAPEWARAVRPLVLVFTAIAFLVTIDLRRRRRRPGRRLRHRRAGADHLGGGRRDPVGPPGRAAPAGRSAFAVISAVFVYTTVANVIERPDGVKIGACFIAGIIGISLVSRLRRAFELRVTDVELDQMARLFVRDCASGEHPPDRQRAGRAGPERVPGEDPPDDRRRRHPATRTT